ncbi:MAG: AAA family ATPase [Clostridiales bacterium]|nr:AAA family ATPase [Clostridiales bacterium]
MEKQKKTLVVNLFAGPGAGKTTCAWEIASELKKRNIETEYVSEYAKELVWDGQTEMLDGSLKNQAALYNEQSRRINRLIGKVDVIVTDSPTVLSLLYLKEPNKDFETAAINEFKQYNNFNLFINRGDNFQTAGRIHNEQESKILDYQIKDFLNSNDIYYGTYYHQTVGVLVDNIVKNLQTINRRQTHREHKIRGADELLAQNTKYMLFCAEQELPNSCIDQIRRGSSVGLGTVYHKIEELDNEAAALEKLEACRTDIIQRSNMQDVVLLEYNVVKQQFVAGKPVGAEILGFSKLGFDESFLPDDYDVDSMRLTAHLFNELKLECNTAYVFGQNNLWCGDIQSQLNTMRNYCNYLYKHDKSYGSLYDTIKEFEQRFEISAEQQM